MDYLLWVVVMRLQPPNRTRRSEPSVRTPYLMYLTYAYRLARFAVHFVRTSTLVRRLNLLSRLFHPALQGSSAVGKGRKEQCRVICRR